MPDRAVDYKLSPVIISIYQPSSEPTAAGSIATAAISAVYSAILTKLCAPTIIGLSLGALQPAPDARRKLVGRSGFSR